MFDRRGFGNLFFFFYANYFSWLMCCDYSNFIHIICTHILDQKCLFQILFANFHKNIFKYNRPI